MSLLPIHIVGGAVGIVSGFVALYALKGATLHRKSGMIFVYAMLVLSITGAVIAAAGGVAPRINIPAALLTGYLVVTAMTTVRPLAAGSRWVDLGAMLVALAVGLTALTFGFQALASGGKRSSLAFPLFMFGIVGVLAAGGDLRMMRSGGLQGVRRLRRHLWRMCFALWIAAASFFLSANRVPEMLRSPALRAIPVLVPILAIFYWRWRLRGKRPVRDIVRLSPPEAIGVSAT